LYGTHNSARIAAQRGVFTVAGKDMQPLEATLESVTGFGYPVLGRINLTGGKDALRTNLATLGFTTSMVYPDLPGLARDLASMVT
jgi:hypothetical protein